MSIKPVTYYQVACDHDGCDTTTETLDREYTTWSDTDGATEDWSWAGGVTTVGPDGERRDYCIEHWPSDDGEA